MPELYLHQKICRKLTDHKYRKCYAYAENITPHEYYYRCKVCGYSFWNEHKPEKLQKDLECHLF